MFQPLPIEAALSMVSFASETPIDLAPDGQSVAYTLINPRRRPPRSAGQEHFYTPSGVPNTLVGADIWLTDIQTSSSRNLTQGQGSSWSPSWSPDSQRFAFYSDRAGKPHLWVWERQAETLRQVSPTVIRSLYGFERAIWMPDRRRVLAKVLSNDSQLHGTATLTSQSQLKRTDTASVRVYSFFPNNNTEEREALTTEDLEALVEHADLALIDAFDGSIQYVARGFNPCWYAISPDAHHIAFTSAKGWEMGNSRQLVYDLVLVSLQDSNCRIIASNIRQSRGTSVSWSPDGKWLSYTTSGDWADGDCILISIPDGEMRRATETPHPYFENPIWDANSQFLYFLVPGCVWEVAIAEGTARMLCEITDRFIAGAVFPPSQRFGSPHVEDKLLVTTQHAANMQVGFYQVDLVHGTAVKLLEEEKSYGFDFELSMVASPEGKYIIFPAQDAQHGPDLWIADANFQPQQLTRINPGLDAYPMGSSQLIEWLSLDGTKLHGALLLPSDYVAGQQYPLIVWVYGGASLSGYVNVFGLWPWFRFENMQMLATRGYVVLFPDAPLHAGTTMQDLAKTVLPGVDKAIEMGMVDPNRIGVMGQSRGGYSTLALIVQTPRFKAAVMQSGYGNLVSLYGQMDEQGNARQIGISESPSGGMGGTPWMYRDRYIENSPVFYLDRVQTPLLIIHGSMDWAVAPFAADEIFVGLRRLGKEVVYCKYPGEGHGIEGFANQVDCWNRIVDWFDGHLKAK